MIKDQRYETPLIASLYFLLTGDYKKGIPEITKPEVATAKKTAVIDYIEEQVASLTEKRVGYIMQLEELAGLDIEKEMQELSDHIQAVSYTHLSRQSAFALQNWHHSPQWYSPSPLKASSAVGART